MSVDDRLDQLRILLRVVLEIGVLNDHHIAASLREASADRCAFALVHFLEDVTDLGPLLREVRYDVP